MFNKELLFNTNGDGIPSNAITSKGGRILYRHKSGMGTVMHFNDGADRIVLVLDARYRAREKRMSSAYVDTSLPNYKGNYGYIHRGPLNEYQYYDTTPSACESLTDSFLNSTWFVDANTSKHNTNVWLSQAGCDCATHCRSVVVNGVGCDIPNIQTLMRMYCEGANIDALDPTVSSYPNLKLSNWFNSFGLWSSTESDSDEGWGANFNGCFAWLGSVKNIAYGCCPVLEL